MFQCKKKKEKRKSSFKLYLQSCQHESVDELQFDFKIYQTTEKYLISLRFSVLCFSYNNF